ncbi:MAG: DUF305 domain-containing protein [Verrucomicrobiaceae bacterium]|nr:DUF305 domain-containing protein [Verrucomicrobiaceae bacterium]
MTNNRLVWVAILISGVSFLGGYLFAAGDMKPVMPENRNGASMSNSHVMPDGSMMANPSGMNMNSMMEGMMQNLRGKTGGDFDKTFVSEMILHHQGAVSMAEAALKTSNRPELLEMAKAIIKAQTEEIAMMQDWQKTWAR